jgi:hypothetical protein
VNYKELNIFYIIKDIAMFEDDTGYDFFGNDNDDGGDELRDNWGDWDRVGIGVDHPLLMNTKLAGLKDTGNLAKMQERFFKIYASDEEKFAHILEAVYFYYAETLEPNLQRDDLINMLDAIYGFQNIYFKNPTCYLFGYYIVDEKSAKINRERLSSVLDLIKHNAEFNNIDIIRYCRLWIEKYNSE